MRDAAPGLDAAGDTAGDGPGSQVADCWSRWLDGPLAIDASSVQELTELALPNVDDRNPWISDNGRHLYFSRNQGQSDVYLATRGSSTGAFSSANPVAGMNSGQADSRAWLTPDELTAALASDRNGSLQIYLAGRSAEGDPFGTPDRGHLTAVNSVGNLRFDPYLSPDGLRLYFAADSGPSNKLQIRIATRMGATADFGTSAVVPGTGGSSSNMADPALYQNERLLLFSAFPSAMGATGDLWYATRADIADSFGTPVRIPSVNSGSNDFDPVLSADGCELYFASTRDGGRFHLFHAQVMK
ncbi:MAG: hypothetical protein E6J91_38695 [Deltaproteobacteria bacterium]|nr:MAG: hypothetical protein E6J91_38695 [Deltaproteobacteria bacterium]